MTPAGTYTVEVCSTATGEPYFYIRTIVRTAYDHPGGWQSVMFQGERYQMYERNPGQFWIDLNDRGLAR